MDITYLGHSSFKIKTKTATIVTDPYDSDSVGFKFPKTEADIITISHSHKDHNNLEAVFGTPFVIDMPGEYETKGVYVFGYSSFHDPKGGEERGRNAIYIIETEDLRIAHLGDLGAAPSTEVMEEISGVDVLMIPVGGVATIGPKEAAELITKIQPRIVIPMHFRTEGIGETFKDFAPVDDFLSEMGADKPEVLDKLFLSKDKLPGEIKVILLERKN
ncbi:MAG: MBL fold metallo-hydrolase [Patescibacteria group bacterium]